MNVAVEKNGGNSTAQNGGREKSDVRVFGLTSNSDQQNLLQSQLDKVCNEGCLVEIAQPDAYYSSISDIAGCDAIIITLDCSDPKAPAIVGSLKALAKQKCCALIIASENLSQSNMLTFLRNGADDFVGLPISDEEMAAVIARVSETRELAAAATKSDAKVVCFAHAAGGAGATTLAVNASVLLSKMYGETHNKVCLLDFDLQYGSASVLLDLDGHSKILDLIEAPERLDEQMLMALMIEHPSGLHVLTSPENPIPLEALTPDAVAKVIDIAQKSFDFVIIDLPQALCSWTETALKNSDKIYAVTQLSVPAVRQLKRMFEALELDGMHLLPIEVIANRASATQVSTTGPTPKQVETALGRKIDYYIPNDYASISDGNNQGTPTAIVRAKGKFARGLSSVLAESLSVEELKGGGDHISNLKANIISAFNPSGRRS
jgi:pilus assembly protein CpaE